MIYMKTLCFRNVHCVQFKKHRDQFRNKIETKGHLRKMKSKSKKKLKKIKNKIIISCYLGMDFLLTFFLVLR